MSAGFLQTIDWQRPWLSPYRRLGASVCQSPDWRAEMNMRASGIRNSRDLPLQFVSQHSLPAGTAYESFINVSGCVPTRENLHDFFNALVWLHFPLVKAQLNARQAAEIDVAAVSGRRGAVRDAATLFDENAALLVVRDPALLHRFKGHEWKHVFFERRQQFHADVQVILFGHALIEKLVAPYKAITAHAFPVIADDAFFSLPSQERLAWLDQRVSARIKKDFSSTMFTPLPVLGVPGWWEGQSEDFYMDTSVFRPPRKAR